MTINESVRYADSRKSPQIRPVSDTPSLRAKVGLLYFTNGAIRELIPPKKWAHISHTESPHVAAACSAEIVQDQAHVPGRAGSALFTL